MASSKALARTTKPAGCPGPLSVPA